VLRFALCLGLVLTSAAHAEDISGKWTFHVKFFLGSGDPWFEFKQEGEKLTGMYHGRFGDLPLNGTVKGDKVDFSVSGEKGTGTYSGTIVADSIKGTAKYPRPVGTGRFEGKRTK
jgi:hypothetical protein